MMRKNDKFKILLHGLNFSPEEIGVGKYSGEMVEFLLQNGVPCCVVTAPPYYPQWKIRNGYSGLRYQTEKRTTLPPATNAAPEEPKTCVAPNVVQSETLEVVRCPIWVPRMVNGTKRIFHLASFGISSLPAALWKAIAFRPRVIMTVEPAAFCMPATLLAARLTGAKAWLHIQDFEVDAAFELGILKQPLLKKLVRTICFPIGWTAT
jgi:colanic acid biosynthesis glycosyl transferase WcaI